MFINVHIVTRDVYFLVRYRFTENFLKQISRSTQTRDSSLLEMLAVAGPLTLFRDSYHSTKLQADDRFALPHRDIT
jgi:hypothetical protein